MSNAVLLDQDQIPEVTSQIRQRLLADLREPDSAAGIARRHGLSRQRVGYHMRALERAGCLELVEKRQRRGCVERVYRALPIAFAQAPDEAEAADRYSWAALVTMVTRALADLTGLRSRADQQGKRLATLAVELDVAFASPHERKAFSEELLATVEALVHKHHQPDVAGARRFRVLLGAYPAPPSRRERS